MSDNQEPAGAQQPNDPWAPPAGGAPQDRVPLDKQASQPPSGPTPPSVHDQPTIIGMPGAPGGHPGSVPPPPVAPGGPATGGYGYPGAAAAPGYGYPDASSTPGYGYPAASMPPPPATGTSGGFGVPGDPYGAGYPAPYAGPAGGWAPQPANGMGIAAMVLGILSVCLFCLYGVVGIILGALGLIFGILGRKRAQRGEATNGGMALAGIITGSIGIVFGIVFILLIAWGVTTAINEEQKRQDRYESDYDPYANSLVIDTRR